MLLGPVQRQIEIGQPRRSERDGLPALQDRLDPILEASTALVGGRYRGLKKTRH